MPDRTGKLSDAEKKTIAENLAKVSNGGHFKCPVCQQSDWLIGELVVAPVRFGGGMSLGGDVYPLAMVICQVCSHTIFMNALRMGITFQKAEEKTEEEAKNG
jgi:hypothetical protein